MKKLLILLCAPVVLTGCWSTKEMPPEDYDNAGNVVEEETEPRESDDAITVVEPAAESTIAFPLKVSGEAKGSWYFEGSFPVKLLDSEGNILAEIQAQATEDWMQEGPVPFEATIQIDNPPTSGTGKLVLSKDNPSGLPENDESVEVEISFGE